MTHARLAELAGASSQSYAILNGNLDGVSTDLLCESWRTGCPREVQVPPGSLIVPDRAPEHAGARSWQIARSSVPGNAKSSPRSWAV